MARTARLELEIDSSRAKAGASTADKVLQGLKRSARETMNDLRTLSRGAAEAGASMINTGRGGDVAEKGIRRAGSAASSASRDMRRLAADTTGATGSMRLSAGAVNGLAGSLLSLRSAAGVVVAVGLAKTILDAADAQRSWNAQLKLAIPATSSLAEAQAEVRRIAADTRSGIDATNDLYAKFSRSSRDLGKSQAEAGRATETFAKTLKISGADTAEVESVTRQFGQALASGVLRGDEFNSVMENSPRLARLLADSLGVSIGELRNMAQQGDLTSDKLYAALTEKKFTASIDAEFKEIPATFGEAMTRIKDAGTVTFAAFDRGGEFSQALIDFALGGVQNMDTLEKRAEDLGIEIRSAFAGLGDVFDPMAAGAESFFAMFDIKIKSTRDSIADLFGFYDSIANGPRHVDNGIEWLASGGGLLRDPKWREMSNTKGTFLKSYDDRERLGQAEAQERRITAALPGYANFGGSVSKLRGYMNGEYMTDSSVHKPDPNSKNYEIGRKMTGAELDGLLASIGAHITSRSRTPAQQQALITKWEHEDPRTRGIKPASPTTSDHVVNGATTRDIAPGPGVTLQSLTALVGKENIKQLFNEGDHFHLALKPEPGASRKPEKSEAEKEAERQAKLAATRKQNEADFFQQLQDEGKAAAMLPAAAEQYNEELKLRKILNDGNAAGEREITAKQKKRIADALTLRNTNEFIASTKRAGIDADREGMQLEEQGKAIAASTAQTEADNLAVQEKLWPFKLDAMNRGLDLQNETVKAALAEVESRERANLALAHKNQLMQEGNSLVDKLKDDADPKSARARQYMEDTNRINASSRSQADKDIALEQLKKQFGIDMGEIGDKFRIEMLGHISEIGDALGGAFGQGVSAIGSLVTILKDQSRGDYKAGSIGAEANNPVSKVASNLKGVSDQLSTVFSGGTGSFFKGLGDKLGKFSDGAAVGQQVASLAKAIGFKKFSTTGSEIGGAIGSFIPIPGGQIIGSIVGGVLGGLFKKSKTGSASLSNKDGEINVTLSGNSEELKKASSALGDSISATLMNIVDSLGGELGNFAVSIGKKDGYFVVDESGRGSTAYGKDNDGITRYKDEGEAIAAAIKNAIADGAIGGISATMQRIITQAGDNLEKGLSDALAFKSVQDELRSIEDPVNFALEGLNKSFEHVVDIMRDAGATTEEWANAEKLYQLKRADIIAQGNNSALQTMKDYLFELTGGTSSVLSPQNRYESAKAQLDSLDARRAAGETVDFNQYKTIADAFVAASRDYQGSDTTFFNDLGRVTASVQAMIDAIGEKAINTPEVDFTPVVSAVDNQTNTLAGLLGRIDASLAAAGAYGGGLGYGGGGSGGLLEPRYLMSN